MHKMVKSNNMSKIRTTIQHEKYRVPAVAILVGLCCLLAYYFHWVLGIDIVFSHFFYIPIILATMWWKKKGLVVAIFLVLFMLASYTLSHPELDWSLVNNLVRAAFFIIVGTTASILSERMEKTENRLNDHAKNLENMVEERTKEIRLERDKFQGLLATIGDGVDVITHDYRVVYANDNLKKIIGKDELEGHLCYEVFLDRDAPCERCSMRRTIKSGETETEEIVQPNGKIVEVRSSPLRLPTGEMAAIEIARDITERKRAEEEILQRAARLAVINRISAAVSSTLDLNNILSTITQQMAEFFTVEHSGILMFDKEKEWGYVLAEYPDLDATAERFKVKGFLAAERIITDQKPVMIEDTLKDPLMAKVRDTMRRLGVKSMLIVPLVVKGETIGSIGLDAIKERRVFSQEDIELAQTIANQVSMSIENARLYEEANRRISELELLHRTTLAVVNSTLELDTALQEVVTLLATQLNFPHVGIALVNEYDKQIVLCAVHGIQRSRWGLTGQAIQVGQGLVGWVVQHGEPLLVNDVSSDQRYIVGIPETRSELVVPLRLGERVIGVINVESPHLDAFTPNDQQLLTTLAGQVAIAIENSRLYQETTQRLAELSVLFEVSGALRGTKNVDDMLPVILKAAIKTVHSDAGTILLLDSAGDPSYRSGQTLVVRAAQGQMAHLLGARLPIDDNVGGHVLKTREPYIIQHVATEPLIPVVLRERLPGIETVVVLPLQVGETAVGVMSIAYTTQHAFSKAELRLLTTITDMATSAIHRAGLFEQLEHRVHELAALFEMGRLITASMRIEDVLTLVVQIIVRNFHVEGCWIHLWDERQNRLVLQAVEGFPSNLVGTLSYRVGEGLTGWVFLEGRVANVPDLAADPRWKREPEYEATLLSGIAKNALVTPLIVSTKTLGVLGVVNKIGAPAFTESDQSLLTTLTGQVAIAIENARLYEDVRNLSITTVRSLATAIDARDPYTRGHSEEVTSLAVQLARQLGWNGADLEMLEFAALLHDVGKIAIPDHILRKVEPLTPDEWNIIRLHPYHSAQIVKPIESLQRVIPWIYHHQERWAGTGYPDGLKGEDIPLASRIIAVVDAFNAMTSDRPYRKALSVKQALVEIKRCADKQFDPQVVEVFLRQVAGE